MPRISPQRPPAKPRKLSVSEYNDQRRRGPNASAYTDPSTGQILSKQEADLLGPFYTPGFTTGFGGRGQGGGQSSFRPRIGSAAGALGSKGIPTSQRGRFEKFGAPAAEMTTAEVSGIMGNGFGGLAEFDQMNAGRGDYGTTMDDVSAFDAVSLPYRDEGGVRPPDVVRTPEMEQAEEDRKMKELELLALQQAPSIFNMGQFAPRKAFTPKIFR